jgi:cyclopentanol dehydrogenase
MRLEGKVAIITGASGGIGEAISNRFLVEGAKVVLTDISVRGLQELQNRLIKFKDRLLILEHDVASEDQWSQLIAHTVNHYGQLNILINNAGIASPDNIQATSVKKWDYVQNVNSRSVFLGIKHTVPEMRKAGGGSIVNISSIYGIIGTGGSAAYHASKAAIRGLTKTAALEFAKDYIRLNSIHPGVIETPMTERKLADQKIKTELKQLTPWPVFGQPLDVANGALFLASSESSFITGTELVIDGGYTAK